MGLDGRAYPVGGELQGRRAAGELPPPVCQVLFQHGALEPVTLPDGEVRVLDGQLRQGRRETAEEGFIEHRQLVEEQAERPAVRDDVVDVHQQQVLTGSEANEDEPAEGTLFDVEGGLRFGGEPVVSL